MDPAGIRPGNRVAIFGAGPMGEIMLQLSKIQGVSTVILIDEGLRKREEALGADFDPGFRRLFVPWARLKA